MKSAKRPPHQWLNMILAGWGSSATNSTQLNHLGELQKKASSKTTTTTTTAAPPAGLVQAFPLRVHMRYHFSDDLAGDVVPPENIFGTKNASKAYNTHQSQQFCQLPKKNHNPPKKVSSKRRRITRRFSSSATTHVQIHPRDQLSQLAVPLGPDGRSQVDRGRLGNGWVFELLQKAIVINPRIQKLSSQNHPNLPTTLPNHLLLSRRLVVCFSNSVFVKCCRKVRRVLSCDTVIARSSTSAEDLGEWR